MECSAADEAVRLTRPSSLRRRESFNSFDVDSGRLKLDRWKRRSVHELSSRDLASWNIADLPVDQMPASDPPRRHWHSLSALDSDECSSSGVSSTTSSFSSHGDAAVLVTSSEPRSPPVKPALITRRMQRLATGALAVPAPLRPVEPLTLPRSSPLTPTYNSGMVNAQPSPTNCGRRKPQKWPSWLSLFKPDSLLPDSPTSSRLGNSSDAGQYVSLTLTSNSKMGQSHMGLSEKNQITHPRTVTEQQGQDTRNTRRAHLQMYYDRTVADLCEMQRHYDINPSQCNLIELQEKQKMIEHLENQLVEVTGFPPRPNCQPHATAVCSPIPYQAQAFRKSPSSENSGRDESSPISQYLGPPPKPRNPSWLASGKANHKKTGSLPESIHNSVEGKDGVSVSRSLSDSQRKRPPLGANPSLSEFHPKTSSLPSNMHESVRECQSPHGHSPTTSPSPASQYHVWGDGEILSPQQEGHFGQESIISAEDDDFSADEDSLQQNSPFSELATLKKMPAHVAIFLNYLLQNKNDSAPFLFYMITDVYHQGALKDMRKWAYEIQSTFLADSAPLRCNVGAEIVHQIESTLSRGHDKEDIMKRLFHDARNEAQLQVFKQLATFRQMAHANLGNIFGIHDITPNMDMRAHQSIMEHHLVPQFEALYEEDHGLDVAENQRRRAQAMSLATILKQAGVAPHRSNSLERCPSFVTKDKKLFMFKAVKKNINVNGHEFRPQQFLVTANCASCEAVLWGAGVQGYQCTQCELSVHKECLESLNVCIRTKKEKRHSILPRWSNPGRKNSSNNASAILEAKRHQEERERQLSTGGSGVSSPAIRGISKSSSSSFLRSTSEASQRSNNSEWDPDTIQDNKVEILVNYFTGKKEDVKEPISSANEHRQKRCTSPTSQGIQLDIDASASDSKLVSLNRSESLNRRRESKKEKRRTKSDVMVDEHTLKNLHPASPLPDSSSSSSLTAGMDSRSPSSELLDERLIAEDPDLDIHPDLPSLSSIIPTEILNSMKEKERKRQEVINELFHTEKLHVKTLKVIQKLYAEPMAQMVEEQQLNRTIVTMLYPNLQQLIQQHADFNNSMKKLAAENVVVGGVGQLLLDRLSGEKGNEFKSVCGKFCQNQSYAIKMLRNRLKKDSKLSDFLIKMSVNKLCRRLHLCDLLPSAMQRITKYPLFIEQLMKYTDSETSEHRKLKEAWHKSKEVLKHVNEATRESENRQQLSDLAKKLDKRALENSSDPNEVQMARDLDLKRHRMLHNGYLTLRLQRQKEVELHAVLLEELLVLMQRQDEKLLLKTQAHGQRYSPIVQLHEVFVRADATDSRALFVIAKSNLLNLVAMSVEERKKWFEYINDAAEQIKKKQGSSSSEKQPEIKKIERASLKEVHDEKTQLQDEEEEEEEEEEEDEEEEEEEEEEEDNIIIEDQDALLMSDDEHEEHEEHEEEIILSERDDVEWFSLHEELLQKDAIIERALSEKNQLVAKALGLPKDDLENVAEISSMSQKQKDIPELLMACIHENNCLIRMIKNSLKITGDKPPSKAPPPPPPPPPPPELSAADGASFLIPSSSNSSHTSRHRCYCSPDRSGWFTSPIPSSSFDQGEEALTLSLPAKEVTSISQNQERNLSLFLKLCNEQVKEKEKLVMALSEMERDMSIQRAQLREMQVQGYVPTILPSHISQAHFNSGDQAMAGQVFIKESCNETVDSEVGQDSSGESGASDSTTRTITSLIPI